MVEAAQITRYERVKQILDRAAKGATADYDGHPEFWNLPLPEFLDVEIYGIRMIAPPPPAAEPSASCCHTTPAIKRSAQSGLIKGLRGAAPFDGNQYPRLMWGGKIVSQDDIGFIAEWIDDGCPANDHQISFPVEGTIKTSKETVEATNVEVEARTFEVYEGSPNEYTYKYGELKQRMNIDCMSETEIDKLRCGVSPTLSPQQVARRSTQLQQHGADPSEPLPAWLGAFSSLASHLSLRIRTSASGRCPGVTMPYWDFTMPQYCPDHPEKGDIIPRSFQAYLTERVARFSREGRTRHCRRRPLKQLRKGMVEKDKRYTSPATFFADVAKMTDKKYTDGKHRERFIDALLAANALWYPLRYPAEYNGGTINTVIHYHYPTADDMRSDPGAANISRFRRRQFLRRLVRLSRSEPAQHHAHLDRRSESSLRPKIRRLKVMRLSSQKIPPRTATAVCSVAGRRLHTREDLYSQPASGDMLSNLTASFDPVFWPIHANIDRIWHEWQQRNPHSLPTDLDAVLTPWSYTIADTLDMARFGYEYVKCAFVIPVGLATPVGRFVSKPIATSRRGQSVFSTGRGPACIACRSCRARVSFAFS